MKDKVGHVAFVLGVILAVILGLASAQLGTLTPWLMSLFVLLGLIVGFLNVTGKETKDFLLVTTVLVIVAFAGGAGANLGGVMYLGAYLVGIFNAILAFVVPAIVVVALKEVYALASVK